ncbi:hypothetical protein [Nonomuraea sp. NPDC049709]|uniref:hypothetical protein n=1 Tax=Nonomuraea sp. NPDC049709 TaxID=3154736 RepID=UPI003421D745
MVTQPETPGAGLTCAGRLTMLTAWPPKNNAPSLRICSSSPSRRSTHGRETDPAVRATTCGVLQASQDFWDDRGEETVEAAEQEIDTAFQKLVAALTARWGSPETVDLEPYLWTEDPAPEPINELCQISGQMLVWRRPDAGRWVALAIGQADREFPIELLAAVGAAPVP